MNKTRDSFIFYRSFFESTLPLDKEQKVDLFDAICNYALDGKLIELTGMPKGFFTLIKPQLDANRKKWANGCMEKSKNEAKDKQKISKTEAKDKQKISKTVANVNLNANVNVECKSQSKLNNENDNKKKSGKKPKGFTPPTLEEIKTYCQERNSPVSANKFYDYYNTGEWTDFKGNKIKNWKQKLITWENKSPDSNSNSPQINTNAPLCEKIKEITKDSLIKKVTLSASNKAVFHFTDSQALEKLQKNETMKNKVKSLVVDILKVKGFDIPVFINY